MITSWYFHDQPTADLQSESSRVESSQWEIVIIFLELAKKKDIKPKLFIRFALIANEMYLKCPTSQMGTYITGICPLISVSYLQL